MIAEKNKEKINLNNKEAFKNIRLATQSDFDYISRWLKEEFDKYGEGFWHNIKIINNFFLENQLFVYIYDNIAVGFITGPIDGPSILNVKKGYQRNGIGRKLFNHILIKAVEHLISVIEIECNPKSSINFWEKMGFSIEEKNNKILGYKVMKYNNKIVNNNPVEVSIKTYSEDIYRDKDTEPLVSVNLVAFLQDDDKVVFQKRLFLKKGKLFKEIDKDLVLSIRLSGKEIFFDKAKRPEAEKIGIKKSEHGYGYYIDYLKLIQSL